MIRETRKWLRSVKQSIRHDFTEWMVDLIENLLLLVGPLDEASCIRRKALNNRVSLQLYCYQCFQFIC